MIPPQNLERLFNKKRMCYVLCTSRGIDVSGCIILESNGPRAQEYSLLSFIASGRNMLIHEKCSVALKGTLTLYFPSWYFHGISINDRS